MTKAQEIETLTALFNSDSYFRDSVSESDFNQMVSNIQDDHPLFLHTTWGVGSTLWEQQSKFERETAKMKLSISVRKVMTFPSNLPGGTPVMLFFVHDAYGEGTLGCKLYVNGAGTGWTLETFTSPRHIENFCDIGGGMGRLYEWVACHTADIIDVIGRKLWDIIPGFNDSEEVIEI